MPKINVFISWSGNHSQRIAIQLADFLRGVFPNLDPFVSSEISGGKFWQTEIFDALEQAQFAILCVTRKNQNSPWLNFEAGSLWKRRDGGIQVLPLLIDLEPRELTGPIGLFQAKPLDKSEMKKLCKEIAAKTGLPEEQRRRNFKAFWKIFHAAVKDDLE